MRTLFTVMTLLLSFVINAQNYKYGKISKEELSKEKSSIDPEAAGEILYETADLKLDYFESERRWIVTIEVEGRLKVYDKDKLDSDFLTKELSLFSPNSTSDKVVSFKGSTSNLVDGKIVETKVKSSDIFTEKKNKYWNVEKMTFANVKNGSVIEYKYTVNSPFYRDIERWYFQQSIPVVYSNYKFMRPEFFVYSMDERGEIKGKFTTNRYPANGKSYNNTFTEHTFENVKPLKKEAFVFNPNNLKSSVRFELMKFEYPGFITENYATSWNQIGQDLMKASDFGGQLSDNGFLDESVQSLSQNIIDPVEKAASIFDFVKNNMNWNGFRSKYPENGLRKTFKDKTGNVADINLLLVSMLQKAGLDASPVVLSTVDNLMLNYTFPSMTSLNYVIAAVEINKKLYLMDATEKYSQINMLPLRVLNHRGFKVGIRGAQEIQLTNFVVSSVKENINSTLNADGTLSGNYSEIKDKYFAMTDKMEQVEDPKEFEKDYLSKYKFDVQDFAINEAADKGMLKYSFKFENLKLAENVGSKIIINPLLFTKLTESSYHQNNRNYPLEFGTVMSKQTTIKIKIPEGYKVESLPQDKQFIVKDNVAGYAYKVVEKDGYLIASTTFEVGHSVLPPTYYTPMKDFENQQITTESNEVILVKI